MILDATLTLSSNQQVLATAPSQNVIDIASVGVGVAVNNAFGTASVFGEDIGIGEATEGPQILCQVGTAFTTANAGTLQVQLQTAIDNGNNQPGTWDTIAQTDAFAVGVLTAGQKLAEFHIPPRYPGQAFPRFYRLNYVVTNAFTAGTIGYAGILTGRDDAPMYPAAY